MNAKQAAEQLKSYGRFGDSELVHMTKGEVAGLQSLAEAAGGSLTVNPDTGQPEAFFLAALLPSFIGALGGAAGLGAMGTAALGAGVGALMNKDDPLMGAVTGGMGGYGGGQLAAGLTGLSGGSAALNANAIANPALAGQAIGSGAGSQASMLAAQNAGFGAEGLSQLAQAAGGASPTAMQTLGAGAQMAASQPMSYVSQLGGAMPAMQKAGMAAAPLMYDYMMPKPAGGSSGEEDRELPRYRYTAGLTGDYYQPGQGTYERNFFTTPTFTRMAEGGIASFARGGAVGLNSGDFIVPADVVAMAGGGSTDAGMAALSRAIGAEPIKGPGDGLSDDIPAHIDGQQPALVANGEMVVRQPKNIKKLYTMLDRIRQQATGSKEQVRPVDLDKALA
jgi:hypothetical protein